MLQGAVEKERVPHQNLDKEDAGIEWNARSRA